MEKILKKIFSFIIYCLPTKVYAMEIINHLPITNIPSQYFVLMVIQVVDAKYGIIFKWFILVRLVKFLSKTINQNFHDELYYSITFSD